MLIRVKTVQELKIGKESEFHITEKFSGIVSRQYCVKIQSYIVLHDGVEKYVLYNSNLEVISNVYRFLNRNYRNFSPNSKYQYFYALKYLYSFLEIIEKEIQDMKLPDFYQLSAFLRGFSAQGKDYEYALLTRRSTKSVRMFFSVYSSYLKFIGLNSSPLLQEKKFSRFMQLRSIVGPVIKKTVAPKYITNNEYKRVMDSLSDENDINQLRGKCILRLMHEAGLRIGEVLGLTFEDYELRRPSSDNVYGKQHLVITIRNRSSDKKYQQAKTCISVLDKRNYLSNDYWTMNVGFQEALAFDFDGLSTYDLLSKYERIAHDEAMSKYPKNYESTIADKVDLRNVSTGENRYIFLNNHGGVLSDAVWNIELRKILIKADIPVDYEYRKLGLNHKFRHAFVMKLLYEMKVPVSQIKGYTRHRNDMSLSPYNNPTSEDLIKLKEDIIAEMIGQELSVEDWII